MNLAYLTNIPSPYRVVMMEAWASDLASLPMALNTYYTDESDQGRGWQVRAPSGVNEMRLQTLVSIPGYGRLNKGLLSMIRGNDIIMIGGFEQGSYLAAAIIARLMRRKLILLFDGFSQRRTGTDPLHVRLIKTLTARLCHSYFANGRVGRDFLVRELGVDDARIFNQYLSVSTQDIDTEKSAVTTGEALRKALNLPIDRTIAAFCGYLIERKRPDLILKAIAAMAREERPLLLFIGRGPLENTLAAQAAELGVDVIFSGFQQGRGLARHYLAADFLVLSSDDDPWGLVINEAMAAGLPIVCSDASGAQLDLVKDGVNGYSFRAGDAGDLTRAMNSLLAGDRAAMGRASQEIIAQWTPAHSAASLRECVRHTLQG